MDLWSYAVLLRPTVWSSSPPQARSPCVQTLPKAQHPTRCHNLCDSCACDGFVVVAVLVCPNVWFVTSASSVALRRRQLHREELHNDIVSLVVTFVDRYRGAAFMAEVNLPEQCKLFFSPW